MERHSKNAITIAHFLSDHEFVEKVYYPHLESHPNSSIAKKQMKLGGGIVSFDLHNAKTAKSVLSKLSLFYLAESLGGIESLAEYPPTMTHGSIEPQRRREIGITDGLIRLSVGLENVEDLICDLSQALDQLL